MRKITIKRIHQWTGLIIKLKILIDKKEVGILKSGESQHWDLEKGDHNLQIRQWWYKSSIIPIVIDDTKDLEVDISYSILTFVIPSVFISIYGILSKLFEFSYFNNLPILLFSALLFEVIIGRKLYLKAKLK